MEERSDDLEILSNWALFPLFLFVFPARLIFDFEFPISHVFVSLHPQKLQLVFIVNYELFPLISQGGKLLLGSRIGYLDEG